MLEESLMSLFRHTLSISGESVILTAANATLERYLTAIPSEAEFFDLRRAYRACFILALLDIRSLGSNVDLIPGGLEARVRTYGGGQCRFRCKCEAM